MWNFRAYEERDFYRVDHLDGRHGRVVSSGQDSRSVVGIPPPDVQTLMNVLKQNSQIGKP